MTACPLKMHLPAPPIAFFLLNSVTYDPFHSLLLIKAWHLDWTYRIEGVPLVWRCPSRSVRPSVKPCFRDGTLNRHVPSLPVIRVGHAE